MKVYLAFSDLCIKKSCFFLKLQWPLTLEASLIIGRNVAAKFALTACKQGGHKGGPTGGPGPSDFRNNEKKCIFKKNRNQVLRHLFLTSSWDMCTTPDFVLVSLLLCISGNNSRRRGNSP